MCHLLVAPSDFATPHTELMLHTLSVCDVGHFDAANGKHHLLMLNLLEGNIDRQPSNNIKCGCDLFLAHFLLSKEN